MPRIAKLQDETKQKIKEACIVLFNEKGLKLTMDDIAQRCHISKKTMYLMFADKEALFLDMVDYIFDKIKKSEQEILENPDLSTIEKIRKILGVLPEGYKEIDFTMLYSLKEKYPAIYGKVEERLESGWESTIALLEQGMKEGVVRNIDIAIVKVMLEASIEQFFKRDILVRNKISYAKALDEVVDILIEGIKKED